MSEWIVTSSILIISVIGIRYLFRRKLAMRARYALWLAVALRLLVPVSVTESSFSVLNLLNFGEVAAGREEGIREEDAMSGGAVLAVQPVFREENPAEGKMQEAENVGDAGGTAAKGSVSGRENAVPAERSSDGERSGWTAIFTGGKVFYAIWLLGCVLAFLVVCSMNYRFRRRVYASRKRYRTEQESRIPVYVSREVDTPCMFGLLRPAVYLTPETMRSHRALRYVLCHENTHYRHRDHLWAVVRVLCVCIHWYNPLVWLAAGLSRQDCELACDEETLEQLGEKERISYGRTLLDFSAGGAVFWGSLQLSTAVSGGKKQLKERLLMIVRQPGNYIGALAASVALVLICTAATFTGRISVREAEQDTVGEVTESGRNETAERESSGDGSSPSEKNGAESVAIVPIGLMDGEKYTLRISGRNNQEGGGYRISLVELNRLHGREEETLQTIRPEDVRVLYTRPSGGAEVAGMQSFDSEGDPLYAKALYIEAEQPFRPGGVVQPEEAVEWLSGEPDGNILVADLNFDGYEDFCLQVGVGSVNIPYYCYLWNPQEECFEPGYRIPNLRVSSEEQLIESATDDGDGHRSVKYYRFDENNILHLTRYTEESSSPEAVFPTLDLTYCEVPYGLPAVDEWDYGTGYGGALTERFVFWAKQALTELYEWSGTKIDTVCFTVTSFGDFYFGNTPEDVSHSRTYYSRAYGERAGFQQCIESMMLSTERVVWYSPVTQWRVPGQLDSMTDEEVVEWYFTRFALTEGERIAGIERSFGEDYVVETEAGKYYELELQPSTREIASVYGPYDSYPAH